MTDQFHQSQPRCYLQGAGLAALTAGTLFTQAGRAYPQETGKKIRLGVVGGGFGASFWWHEHPGCTVTGVTDLYPQRRQRLQKRDGCDAVPPVGKPARQPAFLRISSSSLRKVCWSDGPTLGTGLSRRRMPAKRCAVDRRRSREPVCSCERSPKSCRVATLLDR